jgi:hypothetical protein
MDITKKYLVVGGGWIGNKMIECLKNRNLNVFYTPPEGS